jgi:hypothetical protein
MLSLCKEVCSCITLCAIKQFEVNRRVFVTIDLTSENTLSITLTRTGVDQLANLQ